MDPVLQYLTNFGVLGIVSVMWMLGRIFPKDHVDDLKASHKKEVERLEKRYEAEITELRHALDLERQRSDIGIAAAEVLTGLAKAAKKELTS